MSEKTSMQLKRQNVRAAKLLYPSITGAQLKSLGSLTSAFRLSVLRGEVLCIDGKWYVSHGGLLSIAQRRRCWGIKTMLQEKHSDPLVNRWIFKATVFKSRSSRGFSGYGDADPSNVSSVVQGAEMRIAETRAVNRALRKAYGIGLCSVEELGTLAPLPVARPSSANSLPTNGLHSSNGNGQSRLRDQLCLLIRQYNLDAALVKAYAADFCGTETLRGASRELVESFIFHLSNAAKENRDALVCKLNSYSRQAEVQS
jgi:hypothetical protein